jgi:hypothetical protein
MSYTATAEIRNNGDTHAGVWDNYPEDDRTWWSLDAINEAVTSMFAKGVLGPDWDKSDWKVTAEWDEDGVAVQVSKL